LVANRVRDDDVGMIRERHAVDDALAVAPDDPAVARADEEGRGPFDVAPDGPAVTALRQLARIAAAV
jgi:hypothetical protein